LKIGGKLARGAVREPFRAQGIVSVVELLVSYGSRNQIVTGTIGPPIIPERGWHVTQIQRRWVTTCRVCAQPRGLE
jgi:hypothetical protein